MTPNNHQLSWQPYPERILELPYGHLQLEVFQPQERHVVMGAAGKTEKEVHAQAMGRDHVPLYKRKGGGGTVLLGPNTIVVTVHAGVAHTFRNGAYFKAINQALIQVFKHWLPQCEFDQKGLSDIACGPQKVVGSSIFRRRQYLLYQASVLVELELDHVSRYLKHPPREPDYRRGRSHAEFMTSLRDLGCTQPLATMIQDLKTQLPPHLKQQIQQVDRDKQLA